MISQASKALEAVSWAFRFFIGHLPLILGLSAIPAAERVVVQLWDAPAAPLIPLEVATWAARLLLVVLVFRAAIVADPRWRRDEVDRRLTAFHRDWWPSLVVQGALLTAAFLVFSAPELAASTLSPEDRPLYWAVLLGVKNLTVIPFTLVWLVAVARQALLYEPVPSGSSQEAPT